MQEKADRAMASHLMQSQIAVESTRRWISSMVIGLNLCPFARRVFEGDKIRYAVTEAIDHASLLESLAEEVEWLVHQPIEKTETTLLILTNGLKNFGDYNDFIFLAEELIARLGLKKVFQIASFHPEYQFQGTKASAVENYTNRSPFPLIHLLREDSISRVAGKPAELLEIPERNIERLNQMGREKTKAMWEATLPRENP